MKQTVWGAFNVNFTEAFSKAIEGGQTPTGGVFVISCLILIVGVPVIAKLKNDSPLAKSAVQVLAMMLLIPAAMFLGVTKTIDAQAVTSILGGIAGYVFAKATS